MAGLVIVGASYAAVQVAATAREAGYDGAIRMVGDEPALPYQRPPLSKGYLTGKVADAALPLRGPAFYADNRIELSLGAPVTALDLEGRAVRTATDSFRYDALVLATGSRARPLPAPGAGLGGVHVLRTVADAARLRDEMAALLQNDAGQRAVVIGGGYVGLEVAASLRAGGAEVVVLEFGVRVLNRVATPPFADFVAEAHRARGVTLLTGVQALALDGHAGHVTAVRCSDGVTRSAELVVVGIGAIPNSELAAAAGIACEAGAIAVDGHGRTSAPDVYAAGDCACLTGSAQRLESIQNANDQGRAVGLAVAGQTPPPMGVPWFWSDQFDLKLQMAGLTQGYDRCVTRGSVADSRFSLFYFAGARLLAVDSVNRPAEHMLARKLIAGGATLPFEDVADAGSDLRRFA